MKKMINSLALIALLTTGTASFAQAQTSPVAPAPAATPRVNEVDQRLQNQENRTDAGVTDGQIGAKQEMRDQKTDAHVSQELSKDQAKDGGHITKRQQARMNRQLNKNSTRIHKQRVHGARKPVVPAPAQ